MTRREIGKILAKFVSKHALVVGDAMLDEYIFGTIKRMSPEAPTVPVVLVQNRKYVLGGAANVANNIRALGGKATLVGVIGNDRHGTIFSKLLKQAGINNAMVTLGNRPTTTKTRVFENYRQLARIDDEDDSELDGRYLAALKRKLRTLPANRFDCAIISDYAKGVTTKPIVRELQRMVGKENIIADFKPKTHIHIKSVGIIAPNHKEAAELANMAIATRQDMLRASRAISNAMDTSVIITLGSKGIFAYDGVSDASRYIPAKRVKAIDITGAGDTVTATLALATQAGLTLFEAAEFANRVAAIAVTKLGTATVNPKEILSA